MIPEPDREYYLNKDRKGPTRKKLLVSYANILKEEQIEIRDWAEAPEVVGGPLRWVPSSGYILSLDDLDDLIAALQKIRREHPPRTNTQRAT